MDGDDGSSTASADISLNRGGVPGDCGARKDEEEELELELSLGAKKTAAAGQSWGEYRRILTAEDFPSPLVSRASPRSPLSSSSVSSSKPAAAASSGGGGSLVGAKRVSAVAVGPPSPPRSSETVVGWPPIRAFRINSLVNQSRESSDPYKKTNVNLRNNGSQHLTSEIKNEEKKGKITTRFVKVNMDGDPIGRKVDLCAHSSYASLATFLEAMFHKPTTVFASSLYGYTASKLLDRTSELSLTYEDKDGDWMLVGDVPWGLFLSTVRRLRIMRVSDADGLAPSLQSSKTGRLIQS